MFVIDTNVLVPAAAQVAAGHQVAARWLTGVRQGAERGFVTWSIVYEFLRVVTHRRVFAEPWTLNAALGFVDGLLAAPALDVLVETPRHAAVLRGLEREYPHLAGSVMHDFHTVALMREHGVSTVYSADAHFRRFAHLRAVNPLAG